MTQLLKEALESVRSGTALLVDVREQEEWDEVHLKGAILAPLSQLEKGILPPEIPVDQPVYYYCRRGRRAVLAQEWLIEKVPLGVGLPASLEQLVEIGFDTA